MAKLKDKVQTALDEGRMLVLGATVLLGFQYRSTFEKGFELLPQHTQYIKFGGLALMLVTVGLLMFPGVYHRVVEEGEDSRHFHRFTTRVIGFALLPFAVALGADFYMAVEKLVGRTPGVLAGVTATLAALFLWYGWESLARKGREAQVKEKKAMSERENDEDERKGTEVKDKIRHVLTEARVVLPGVQALLGFQLATMLVEGFDKLPASSKYVHLASLALMALSIVLLMTPAAYHRIVEEGEETEHFHRVASLLLLASMPPLALGLAGDFYVVTRKITESPAAGLCAGALAVVFFSGLWFGFTFYRRAQRRGVPAGRLEMNYARK